MEYTMQALLRAGAAALAAATLATPAAAATIIGGATEVTVTAAPALTGLGLSFAPFGTASVTTNSAGLPVASFLITGGTRDDLTGALLVRHDGSGLTFSSAGRTLSVGNFVIDTAAATVTATATANGSPLGTVPLFTIGSGLSLLLTPQAAGAFTTVFNAPNLAGTQFGTADVNAVFAPTAAAVPEPAAWALMILGFGLVGRTLRGRQRVTAVTFAR
jgi:hypothetical protein